MTLIASGKENSLKGLLSKRKKGGNKKTCWSTPEGMPKIQRGENNNREGFGGAGACLRVTLDVTPMSDPQKILL